VSGETASTAELAWENEGGSLQRRESTASPSPSPLLAPASVRCDASLGDRARRHSGTSGAATLPRRHRCAHDPQSFTKFRRRYRLEFNSGE
jgi:hypothetical protein